MCKVRTAAAAHNLRDDLVKPSSSTKATSAVERSRWHVSLSNVEAIAKALQVQRWTLIKPPEEKMARILLSEQNCFRAAKIYACEARFTPSWKRCGPEKPGTSSVEWLAKMTVLGYHRP